MTDPVYARVVSVLMAELEAIEELHYRHHVCLLLLGVGDATYLGVALDDVAAAEDELARLDLLRAAAVDELGLRWELDPSAVRLSDLVRRADETSGPPLAQLRERLREATADLVETRELVTRLAGTHIDEVRGRRARVEQGPTATYDRSGRGRTTPLGTTQSTA